MKVSEKRSGTSSPGKYARAPRAARFINIAIAIILLGISAYHFTQPNQAWRSGTAELISAILLLTAAYYISSMKAVVIDLVFAVVISGLGIRHLIHGGGWVSGTTELLFVVLLVTAANLVYRNRGK
jgi:hypothetical protein